MYQYQHGCWVPAIGSLPKKNYMLWPLPSLEQKPVMPLLLRFRSFRFQVWDSGWNLINRTLVLCSCPFKMILDNLNFYNWRTRHCWYIGRAFKCWWAKNMNKYLLNNAKSLPMGRGCHYARLNDLFNFLKYWFASNYFPLCSRSISRQERRGDQWDTGKGKKMTPNFNIFSRFGHTNVQHTLILHIE